MSLYSPNPEFNVHIMASNNNYLYYIGLVFAILCLINPEIAWPIPLVELDKALSLLCLSIHAILNLGRYKSLMVIYLGTIFIFTIVVGLNANDLYLFVISFLLIIGAKNIDYNRILYVHFITGLCIMLISVIGAMYGIIRNVVVYRGVLNDVSFYDSGSIGRQSLGYVWPTGFAIHASFLLLSYWLLKKARLKLYEWILFVYLILILIKLTDTRQIIILMLLPLFSLLITKTSWIWKSVIIKYFLILIIPILTIVSLWIVIAYNSSNEYWMVADLISSGRLGSGQDSINKYGIPMFGQYFKMYGAENNSFYYNYIDSSFIQALVLWGWLMTLLLVSTYVVICKRAYDRHNFPLVLAVFVTGLSCLTSQYLFQIMSCPLLLALFAKHKDYKKINYVKERNIKEANTQLDTRVLSRSSCSSAYI